MFTMSFLSYNIQIAPNPAFHLSLSAAPDSVTMKVDKYDNFSVNAQVTNVDSAESIFASVITLGSLKIAVPIIGQIIESKIEKKLKEALDEQVGQTHTLQLGEPLGYTMEVQGVKVKLALNTVNLANYNGMLMATGDVRIGQG
ncbi:hypothetical protein GK047_12505 [Paenibacillus sp. SYP-B3998]|uniref:Uncharacterized protein n=1 Tax=Paenibacillus sp. SYP-B3998 TaxID=2678564 RepID=A0A6G3ZXG9_9BACL|nr:hypothetical protein [Paenibacillus sp. SYP-B3998]NEW06832.1 hypothetical protein [Paenibacillus sp. SYP-B3998]